MFLLSPPTCNLASQGSSTEVSPLSRFRKRRSFAGILFLAAGLSSCGGVQRNKAYWATLRTYEGLSSQPTSEDPEKKSPRSWKIDVKLADGTGITITATAWIGSDIWLKYSDEAEPRVAYTYGDYIYPADIRIDNNIMYAKVDGLAAGIWQHTRIIISDLVARKKVRDVVIDRKDLKTNHKN